MKRRREKILSSSSEASWAEFVICENFLLITGKKFKDRPGSFLRKKARITLLFAFPSCFSLSRVKNAKQRWGGSWRSEYSAQRLLWIFKCSYTSKKALVFENYFQEILNYFCSVLFQFVVIQTSFLPFLYFLSDEIMNFKMVSVSEVWKQMIKANAFFEALIVRGNWCCLVTALDIRLPNHLRRWNHSIESSQALTLTGFNNFIFGMPQAHLDSSSSWFCLRGEVKIQLNAWRFKINRLFECACVRA